MVEGYQIFLNANKTNFVLFTSPKQQPDSEMKIKLNGNSSVKSKKL